jgi:hypothetical protein
MCAKKYKYLKKNTSDGETRKKSDKISLAQNLTKMTKWRRFLRPFSILSRHHHNHPTTPPPTTTTTPRNKKTVSS